MTTIDELQRFIFVNTPIRGEFIRLQESYQTIISQHDYPPIIKHLLGQALCVAGLLSATIKYKGRLTVQFRGDGKLNLLLAQCDDQFNLRGLAKWEGSDPSYDELMASFNQGVLTILLDSGFNSSNQYQGIVAWRGNSLVESIEGYFKDSEQLATKLWLCVDDESAAGLLLQVIPASDQNSTTLENTTNPQWQQTIELTNHVRCEEMLNLEYPTLLNRLYPESEIKIFPATSVAFGCTCSRKRGEDAILMLGQDEAEAELQNKQMVVVTCDFCNKEYVFNSDEVKKIFAGEDKPSQLH